MSQVMDRRDSSQYLGDLRNIWRKVGFVVMRKLLLIEIFSIMLTLGLSGAHAAPVANIGPMSDTALTAQAEMAVPYSDGRLAYVLNVRDEIAADRIAMNTQPGGKTFIALARNLATVAATGLVMALASVGVGWLWMVNPIRYPFRIGPV
jgi:hypothetical protein